MKLTKGMKKALSLLLSAAMVVTGVNVTANKASAEEGDEARKTVVSWAGELTSVKETSGSGETTSATDGLEWNVTGAAWGGYVNVVFDKVYTITDDSDAKLVITGTSEEGGKIKVCGGEDGWGNEKEVSLETGDFVVEESLTAADKGFAVSLEQPKGVTVTITKIELTVKDDLGSVETGSGSVTTTTAPVTTTTDAPVDRTTAANFKFAFEGQGENVTGSYAASLEGWQNCQVSPINVTGNGIYPVQFTAVGDAQGFENFYLDADLTFNNSKNIKIEGLMLSVSDANGVAGAYPADKTDWTYADNKKANAEGVLNPRRLNVRNPWNPYTEGEGDQAGLVKTDIKGVNAFGDPSDSGGDQGLKILEGDVVTLYIKVSGMAADAAEGTVAEGDVPAKKTDDNRTESAKPTGTPDPNETTNPGTTTTTAPNTTATTVPTGGSATATPSAVSTASGVTKISVPKAKKTVVVAANKSVKVSFTMVPDPSTATTPAAVTASIGNKKNIIKTEYDIPIEDSIKLHYALQTIHFPGLRLQENHHRSSSGTKNHQKL